MLSDLVAVWRHGVCGGIKIVRFRIQHLQWIGGFVAAAACLALGGVSLRTNLADYARYHEGTEQLARFHAVLAAATAISAERGPANSAMGGAEADRAALIEALAARRAETDRKLAEMEAAFAGAGAGAQTMRLLSRDTRDSLAGGRRRVDRVVSLPSDERNASVISRAIGSMFAAADAATVLRDRLGQEIIRLNPQIAADIMLNTTASTLREEAGRLGSYVVMMLAAGEGRSARFLPDFDRSLLRIVELRRILADHAPAFFAGGPIERKIQEMDLRYFAGSLAYAQSVAGSLVLPGSPNPDAFTRGYVPGMQPVVQLRELIADSSRQRMDALRDRAFQLVMASVLLTGVAVFALGIVGVIFRNGLFRPLITARQQIAAIAHGDLSEPQPVRRVSNEIRAMFEELNLLRDHQRQRQSLEEDQRRMAEQLRRLSETDMLTGLLNRRALNDAAVRALAPRDGSEVAVILFDVDNFKRINDTLGHAVGDAVLKGIARTLAPLVPAGDAFARYGGEEFVVLLHGAGLDTATAVAEAMRRCLEDDVWLEAAGMSVTASFGAAVRPSGSGMRWEELVATADRRLYRAKQDGRNRVCSSDASVEAPKLAPLDAVDIDTFRRERAGAR
jgi:diguanylate cyclase (GGDEF)-like protein